MIKVNNNTTEIMGDFTTVTSEVLNLLYVLNETLDKLVDEKMKK